MFFAHFLDKSVQRFGLRHQLLNVTQVEPL